MAKTYAQLLATLNDIDAHVEHVAINNPPDSDLNIVAHAIRNLDGVVRELIEQTRPQSSAAHSPSSFARMISRLLSNRRLISR